MQIEISFIQLMSRAIINEKKTDIISVNVFFIWTVQDFYNFLNIEKAAKYACFDQITKQIECFSLIARDKKQDHSYKC